MITDERITELWNLASNTATSKPDWTYSEIIFATVRAVIAEHDAELRKQEPKAVWLQMSNETGFPSRVNSEAHLCAIKHPDFTVENLYLTPKPPHDEASLKALYAAPIPPMPSQQEAADRITELEAELAEWEKLKDPINLHVNLLRGVPCRLDRMQHLLHLAGATDYDDLRAVREAIYQVAVQIGKEMDK